MFINEFSLQVYIKDNKMKLINKVTELEKNIEYLTNQKNSLEYELKFPINLWYKTISKLNDVIKSTSNEKHSIQKIRNLFKNVKKLELEIEVLIKEYEKNENL